METSLRKLIVNVFLKRKQIHLKWVLIVASSGIDRRQQQLHLDLKIQAKIKA
jgi:hypothetical protein